MVRISFNKTSKRNTLHLKEFYRDAGDGPGSGKKVMCAILHTLPDYVKYITVDASGGKDEMNTRKWWFQKDKRTFANWKQPQILRWLEEHQVSPGFIPVVLQSNTKSWLRILASNEKLVKYYEKLGFRRVDKYLLPVVKMTGTVEHIKKSCS